MKKDRDVVNKDEVLETLKVTLTPIAIIGMVVTFRSVIDCIMCMCALLGVYFLTKAVVIFNKGYSDSLKMQKESLRRYNKNLDYFIEGAKKKYDETVNSLGKPASCIGDDAYDIWFPDDKTIRMKKWDTFLNEIKCIDGKYTSMIINGECGNEINFEYQIIDNSKIPLCGGNGVEHHLHTGKEYQEKVNEEQKTPDGKEFKFNFSI